MLLANAPLLMPKEKMTVTKAFEHVNQAVDRLNSALGKIQITTDKGIIFDSANLDNPKAKKENQHLPIGFT